MPNKQNRHFGFVMIAAVGLLIVAHRCRSGFWSRRWILVFIFITAVTLMKPALLEYARRVWMRLGELLHGVTQPFILAIVFYGVITPFGLMRKWLGYSKIDNAEPDQVLKNSYWVNLPSAKVAPHDYLKRQF